MSDAKNAALIAEARQTFCWPDERSEDELGNRLADALEAADARSATEYQRGHDRAMKRTKAAITNWQIAVRKAEAERDAALAEVETQRRNALGSFAAAAGALAVIEQVRALHREKHGENDRGPYEICDYDKTAWPCKTQAILNPYRANPEPTDSTREDDRG